MNWWQNILVGILFFGALALAGFFTIVSESGPFAPKGNQMVLYFDNADGIKTGARVTILGVPAGTVVGLDLVSVDEKNQPAEDGRGVAQRVAVTIELRRPVKFYSNYQIAVKNETILSGKIIAIDPGSSRPGPDGLIPKTVDVLSPSTTDLKREGQTALQYTLAKGGGAYVNLQGESSGDPLAGLSEMISENRGDIRRTLNNVAEITQKINQGKGTIGLLVNDDELHRNANTVLTDAQIVVRELRESLEDTREQAPVNSFLRAALTAF